MIFTLEETFNKQNDSVYARSSKEARELRSKEVIILVWWGVSYDDVTSLHFCERGVKTAARNYQLDILTNVVEPLNQTIFQNRPWIFQHGSAPVHKAQTSQQWLENHVLESISCPDFNPLDYRLWSVLKVCTRPHHNLESSKQALLEAVDYFSMDVIHTAIDEWPNRL
jgi:hypothetical protein